MTTEEQIIKLAQEFNNVSENEVTASSKFEDDLAYDSLDCVELIMAVEDEFDIDLGDDGYEHFTTVKDLIDKVEQLKA